MGSYTEKVKFLLLAAKFLQFKMFACEIRGLISILHAKKAVPMTSSSFISITMACYGFVRLLTLKGR